MVSHAPVLCPLPTTSHHELVIVALIKFTITGDMITISKLLIGLPPKTPIQCPVIKHAVWYSQPVAGNEPLMLLRDGDPDNHPTLIIIIIIIIYWRALLMLPKTIIWYSVTVNNPFNTTDIIMNGFRIGKRNKSLKTMSATVAVNYWGPSKGGQRERVGVGGLSLLNLLIFYTICPRPTTYTVYLSCK